MARHTPSLLFARPCASMAPMWGAFLLLVLLCPVSTVVGQAQERTYYFTSSLSGWRLPAGAADMRVTLWGGGGGATQNGNCVAGGGSGAAIIGRPVDLAALTAAAGLAVDQISWEFVVGRGGMPVYPSTLLGSAVAESGGESAVIARAPNGTVLFSATAHGGGGGEAAGGNYWCAGGGGGGSGSSAWGGSGGADDGLGGPGGPIGSMPTEGAQVGDIKAGGSGGCVYARTGAPWSDPTGNNWVGGTGMNGGVCLSAGGAAGFNGKGADGDLGGDKKRQVWGAFNAAPNSGAGGGSGMSCIGTDTQTRQAGAGGSGGVRVTYVGVQPSPSTSPSNSPTPSVAPTRSPTASPSRSPSSTPSPSPSTLRVYLAWSTTTNSYLSARPDGSIKIASAPLEWERWTATRLPSGLWTFKSYFNTYLSAQMDGSMKADRTEAKEWEGFEVIYPGGNTNRWILKTYFGRYVDKSGDQIITSTNANVFWTRSFV